MAVLSTKRFLQRMADTGLLVLTQPSRVGRLLPVIEERVKETLYVQIYPSYFPYQNAESLVKFTSSCRMLYGACNVTSDRKRKLDIRILLREAKNSCRTSISTKRKVEIVFYDDNSISEEMDTLVKSNLLNVVPECRIINLSGILDATGDEGDSGSDIPSVRSVSPPKDSSSASVKLYENVVLGGTFDRLHSGHKILLSEAVMHCSKRLVVGVTDTSMLKSKKLWELIEPCTERIRHVEDFLKDVDPSLQYEIVPISDPFGPTRYDPDLQMIIVSAETLAGGKKVNAVRKENGLIELDIHVVDLLTSDDEKKLLELEEEKISSSNSRLRLLGTRLCLPEVKPNLPQWPYIIGLTGGIASGKSSMCKRVESLGAGIINCDILAHKLYRKGELCYSLVVEHFGEDILDSNGEIDRKKLGPIVFQDKEKLTILNNILWPHIMDRAQKESLELYKKGYKIVVIEAAMLIQAGWDQICHEIWLCIVSPNVAKQRLLMRDNLTPNEAEGRLAAQLSNAELVAHAHVVFCTEWDTNFSQYQMEKAWNDLQRCLETTQQS